MCRLLAREGYAPKELPRLTKPLGPEFEPYSMRELWREASRLRHKLRSSESDTNAPDDARRLEALELLLRNPSTERQRKQAFEEGLRSMLPRFEASLARDDDRMAVRVKSVYVSEDQQVGRTHVVVAKVEVSERIRHSGYGLGPGNRPVISMKPEPKTLILLEADFRSREIRVPEPGLVSEGLGFLDYIWAPKTALSLGKLGLKLVGKRAARRLAKPRGGAGGKGERMVLMHGTHQGEFHKLGALGEGRISVKHAAGEHQDLGQGFYLTTDRATASEYARRRRLAHGTQREDVLAFEVSVSDLGKVVDIRRGGRFYDEWQRFLDEDAFIAVFGVPAPGFSTKVRAFLTGVQGIEKRGLAFERFLKRVGMEKADTIIAPLGDDVFTGITVGAEATQVCIRSQRIADRLNAQIRGN